MCATRSLAITIDADGDCIVSIGTGRGLPDRLDGVASIVEFCTPSGGGRSPRTLAAIRELKSAMEEDNVSTPSRDPDAVQASQ